MAKPRRTTNALPAPTSLLEATALAARYANLMTEAELARAAADKAIAAIEAKRDLYCTPLETDMKEVFKQLSRWWSVAGAEVTQGKRRSAEIAGLVLGIRLTTPKLVLPKAAEDLDKLIASLKDFWADRLTIKTSINKPVVIADLRSNAPKTSTGIGLRWIYDSFGVKVSQRDEFFIDRPHTDGTDPESVPADATEAAEPVE